MVRYREVIGIVVQQHIHVKKVKGIVIAMMSVCQDTPAAETIARTFFQPIHLPGTALRIAVSKRITHNGFKLSEYQRILHYEF